MTTAARPRIDWREIRDTIRLADVATRLLGEPAGRRGERSSRRLWWLCPFHPDSNPSFCVRPGDRQWRCWGCGAKGDAIELARRLNPGWTFREAVAYLTGSPMPSMPAARPRTPDPTNSRPPVRAAESPPGGPTGLDPSDAVALVREAAARLWEPAGRDALDYLRGRGLSEATAKAARLGWTPRADGVPWKPPGLVIPWHDDDGRLALVKIRVPDEWREGFPKDRRPPKYIEAFRHRPALYPSMGAIRPGMPLIVTEGEFDALLLGQELAGLAVAVTLGSASNHPTDRLRDAALACPAWYSAHDADEAGDRAAAEWPARAVRVRPPVEPPGKDWGDVHASGLNRIRYLWGGILPRPDTPWSELAARRWGPGLGPRFEGPGFVADRHPHPSMPFDPADDFDREERAAIIEHEGGLNREAAERAAGLISSLGAES